MDESFWRLIDENTADLISLEDSDEHYLYVCSSGLGVFGWRTEELLGRAIGALHHPEDAGGVIEARQRLRRLETACAQYRYRLRCRTGRYRWVESRARLCQTAPQYIVTTTRDIEAHMQELRSLEWRATYDALTGLLNRGAIEMALEAEFSRSRRRGETLSIALFDVDDLKHVNDTDGHIAGDALLRALGRSVTRCKRHYDLLGRWGGDEFLLLLPNTSAEAAATVVGRMRAALAEALPGVRLSFGMACNTRVESVQALLAQADLGLYQGKRRGGDEIVSLVPLE